MDIAIFLLGAYMVLKQEKDLASVINEVSFRELFSRLFQVQENFLLVVCRDRLHPYW